MGLAPQESERIFGIDERDHLFDFFGYIIAPRFVALYDIEMETKRYFIQRDVITAVIE